MVNCNGQPPPIRYVSLVALPTKIGWILSGCEETTPGHYAEKDIQSSTNVVSTNLTVSERSIESFWNLEQIGIMPQEEGKSWDNHPQIKQFLANLEYSSKLQAYKVKLPWKSTQARASIGDNFLHALKRLDHLHRKTFANDPSLQASYYEIFEKYLKQGIIEVVPPAEVRPHHMYPYKVFYLPHRPIIKEGANTRIRPVFDASSYSSTGVSLNDAVSTGPSLYPDLVKVIIRFRRWPIAITGDICQAFFANTYGQRGL